MKRTREANDTIISPIDGCQYRLFIEQDQDPVNPRKYFDNAGTIISWFGRYRSPDDKKCMPTLSEWCDLDDVYPVYNRVKLFDGTTFRERDNSGISANWQELVDILHDNGQYIIIPIRHDRDGISQSYGGNTNGYACMSKETILKEWGKPDSKIITSAMRKKAIACLESEIETYNQWANGDVWGIIIDRIIPDENGDFDDESESEELDSCWEFFGHDYARQEGLYMLKYCATGNSAVENARNLQGLKELATL